MSTAQQQFTPDLLGHLAYLAGAVDLAARQLADVVESLQVDPDGVIEEPGESWRASGLPLAPATA